MQNGFCPSVKVILCLLACMGFLSSCVYGPKAEKKSPLNVLNGENYDNSSATGQSDQLLVPVVKRKERITRIRGSVVRKEGIADVPLKNVRLELIAGDGKPLEKVATDIYGEFSLSGVFKNGNYVLRVASEKYGGELSFKVEDYEVDHLVVQAKPLAQEVVK
jgi:hypothetical protein